MATVQRPLKEGNVRTYQGKVGLGFTDILASEADADFDTIYAAWNGGIGTEDIKTAAVTAAKLDPTLANATAGQFAATRLDVTARASVVAVGNIADVIGNDPSSIGYLATVSSWITRADYGADAWEVWRRPAGGGSFSPLARLVGTGDLSLVRYVDPIARAGVLWHNAGGNYGAGTFNIVALNSILTNPGGVCDIANSQFNLPANSVTLLTFNCILDANPGGCLFTIEGFDGAAWRTRGAWWSSNSMYVSFSTLFFGATSYRVRFQNTSGSTRTILSQDGSPLFGCVVLGRTA